MLDPANRNIVKINVKTRSYVKMSLIFHSQIVFSILILKKSKKIPIHALARIKVHLGTNPFQ